MAINYRLVFQNRGLVLPPELEIKELYRYADYFLKAEGQNNNCPSGNMIVVRRIIFFCNN